MSAETGTSVDLREVRKSYGRTEVLHGISVSVPAGSFTTLLGPSGSGKTTTLAIISGLLHPDSGNVYIGERDCTRLPVHRRDLGFVFQSYALFPHMNVERNVGYSLRLRKVPRGEIRRRVGEALEIVQLSGHRRHYPGQLSGGQQQRVALARAIVFNPRVLLMDEPLGALDAGLRVHLQREIVRIGRELSVTVIYVTHDQSEALTMSDQVVLFNDGRIEQAGSPQDIYSAPQTAFAARFMGNAPLLPGVLEAAGDGFVVRHGEAATPVSPGSVHARGLVPGAGALAVMRSEYLRVALRSTAGDVSSNRIGTGRVTDVIYAGARERIDVELRSGLTFEYYYDSADAPRWQRGDEVEVSVRPDKLPPVVADASTSREERTAVPVTGALV